MGRALSTSAQEHQLLPKSLALPVFSSDTLSSVAYATEEMMLVFVTAGVAALSYRLPIALAIAALLAIVVTSYRQTVKRVSARRRLLHRRPGEPRHDARPHRGRRDPHRLRADRRGLDHGGHDRDHVGGARPSRSTRC